MVAAALVGCGSDGSVSVDESALAPSRADYVLGADRVCSRYEDRVEAEAETRFALGPDDVRVDGSRVVFRPGRRPRDAEIEAFATDFAIPSLRQQLAELRSLRAPEGEEARVTRIYDGAATAIDSLAAEPALLSDQAATRRLFAPSTKLARDYGIRVCGL